MNSELPIAMHILGFLASRNGQPLTSEIMARTYGTSPVVLRRVLAKLRKAGLVETKTGAGGGSLLARSAASINLREAYEAVASDSNIMARHPTSCSEQVARVVAGYINQLCGEAEEVMLQRLESVTVAEMDQTVRSRLRSPEESRTSITATRTESD